MTKIGKQDIEVIVTIVIVIVIVLALVITTIESLSH